METKIPMSSVPVYTPKYYRQKSHIPIPLSSTTNDRSPVRQWATPPPPPRRSKSMGRLQRRTKKPILSVPKSSAATNAKCIPNTARPSFPTEISKSKSEELREAMEVQNIQTTRPTLDESGDHQDSMEICTNTLILEPLVNSQLAPLNFLNKNILLSSLPPLGAINELKQPIKYQKPIIFYKNRGNQTEFRTKSNLKTSCTCSIKGKFIWYIVDNIAMIVSFIGLLLTLYNPVLPSMSDIIFDIYNWVKPESEKSRSYIRSVFSKIFNYFSYFGRSQRPYRRFNF